MVLIILLSAIMVFGGTSDIIINGRKVSNAEIEAIVSQFGMSGQVTIPLGRIGMTTFQVCGGCKAAPQWGKSGRGLI